MGNITWVIDLGGLIDQDVKLSTKEGFNRKGKLTKVNFGELVIEGDTVQYPTEIILNGDDPIPFTQIEKLSLV
jgi:hypothetical protein